MATQQIKQEVKVSKPEPEHKKLEELKDYRDVELYLPGISSYVRTKELLFYIEPKHKEEKHRLIVPRDVTTLRIWLPDATDIVVHLNHLCDSKDPKHQYELQSGYRASFNTQHSTAPHSVLGAESSPIGRNVFGTKQMTAEEFSKQFERVFNAS